VVELESGTGALPGFQIAAGVLCENAKGLEKSVHKELRDYRKWKNKEFFSCTIDHAIEVTKRVCSTHNIKILKIDRAENTQIQSRIEQNERLFEEAREILKRSVSQSPENYKSAVMKAHEIFKEVYEETAMIFGPDSIKNTPALNQMCATLSLASGQPKIGETVTNCIKIIEEVKRIQELNLEKYHIDLLRTYKWLASQYAVAKKFDSAIDNYSNALQVQINNEGEYNNTTAFILSRLGGLHAWKGDKDQAKVFYLRARSSYQKSGYNHMLDELDNKLESLE